MHDLGFTLVRLAWLCGAGALGWDLARRWVPTDGARREALRRGRARWVGVAAEVLVIVSLWLPWVEGTRPDGRFRAGGAWAELDPFSTVTIALLALTGALRLGGVVRPPSHVVVVVEAGAMVGLVAANLLIQSTTERGSHLLGWAWVTLVLAVVGAAIDVVTTTRRSGSSAEVAGGDYGGRPPG